MLKLSSEKIGFTSAAKVGFIHGTGWERDINFVPTAFISTCAAIESLMATKSDTGFSVCLYNGQLVAMTAKESQETKSPEVTLKLENNEWKMLCLTRELGNQ